MKQVGHPPQERLTPELAHEVCERNSATAMLSGSIVKLGNSDVITLDATVNAKGLLHCSDLIHRGFCHHHISAANLQINRNLQSIHFHVSGNIGGGGESHGFSFLHVSFLRGEFGVEIPQLGILPGLMTRGSPPATTPEPFSLILLGTGLAGFGGTVLRRVRRKA